MTALGSILRQGRRPYMGTLLPRPSSGSSHQSDTDVLRTPKWDKVDKTTSSAKFLKNTSKGDRDFFFFSLVMVVLPFQVRMAGIIFFFVQYRFQLHIYFKHHHVRCGCPKGTQRNGRRLIASSKRMNAKDSNENHKHKF